MAQQVTSNAAQMAQVALQSGNASSPAMEELANLLAKRLKKEMLAEDEAESQTAAARKANADNMVLVRQQELATQSACTHMKPRGFGTALAGQKTHRGWSTSGGPYCGKEFSDPPQRPEEKIPGHIFPDLSLCGGPH